MEWGKCRFIVGMHPDQVPQFSLSNSNERILVNDLASCSYQATDPIVDTALKAQKPFAVVPCCVFPKMFSARRLQNGSTVRSYEQVRLASHFLCMSDISMLQTNKTNFLMIFCSTFST